MLHILENSDLLGVESGIICHQVNCIGAMGAGIALQIRNKWPSVYSHYKKLCMDCTNCRESLLGQIQFVDVDSGLKVANCFGQMYPGRRGVMTDFSAWDGMFEALGIMSAKNGLALHFPWRIGCGLAGGDWDTMLGKMYSAFNNSEIDAFVHKLQP